ncbi:ShlB/FhaC/HecB family hemolysin secretion/activation protein [Rhodanobacter sp. S2-g]|uniref:ShlB/FhaC/HecB family hemolysin secretion/activation protein n=1 Tax=Rhodanobacter geophilus TaxID=3162488 RepID=A0ABV3QMD9_9GAMM
MRRVCLAAALALVLGTGEVWAQAAGGSPPQILVSGVPATTGAGGQSAVQAIIDREYRQTLAADGSPAALTAVQLQALADRITLALHKAGYPDAHAYLPGQVVAYTVHTAATGGGQTAVAAAAPPAQAPPVAPQQPAAPADRVVPPLKDRDVGSAQTQQIAVQGFHVDGVGEHKDAGITPAAIQALADAQFHKLGGGNGQPAQLGFDQMQGVADAITQRYRKAGFIVATAFLPAQTVGDDHVVRIQVLEGKIGRIVVKGTKRYYPGVIAAPSEKLRGKALQKSDVDTALLYDRDLPGVSVTSTFQPGEQTGATDLIMVAREAPRPYTITLGANNYGTDLTGRYRAEAGITWNSPLGIGDSLAANVNYALDPSQNVYGSLVYRAPTVVVPGLSAVLGATRSELQINSGQFANLNVKGPSSSYFGGADWKFLNDEDLKLLGSLHLIREESKLNLGGFGFPLSDERFDLAELGFGMEHTDKRFHGVDLVQVSVRKSISDDSRQPDLVSPDHSSSFLSERISYTRLQFLTRTQRLYFKFNGQYSDDVLAPLEQFAIGGPDSVRAYPIADALSARGYYTSLEYHVDAPGFSNKASPFRGRPWRELLEVETFLDYARGFPVARERATGLTPVTYSGAGAGFIFRLPFWHHLEFHLDGAVPLGSQKASDDHGYHVYGRFGLTF